MPNFKEVFYEAYGLTILDLIIATARDPELRRELVELLAAWHRYVLDGETSTRPWQRSGRGRGGEGREV